MTAILKNAPDLCRWWPSVYLDVKVLKEGDENGIGKQVELFTKGWLPYTLRWKFEVTDSNEPYGFTIEAIGDFIGKGIWTFTPDSNMVRITYDWNITAEKGILKHFSFLLKPIFKANHLWAMRKGEESLKLELLRRNTRNKDIPLPPSPTFYPKQKA